jgi:cytoskeletal protein RodZ
MDGLPADRHFTLDSVPPALRASVKEASQRVTDRGRGYDMRVEHMESPAKAERKQARERQFLPPIWPLLAIVVVIVGIAVWLSH